jgi:hypothetical protein
MRVLRFSPMLSGDPLSVYSHVLETWIEGKKVLD